MSLSRVMCNCGRADDARPVLLDVLETFSDTGAGGMPYLSLHAREALTAKYGGQAGMVELIYHMIDRLGVAEHSSAVGCSASLTELGVSIRDELRSTP